MLPFLKELLQDIVASLFPEPKPAPVPVRVRPSGGQQPRRRA